MQISHLQMCDDSTYILSRVEACGVKGEYMKRRYWIRIAALVGAFLPTAAAIFFASYVNWARINHRCGWAWITFVPGKSDYGFFNC